MEQAASHRHAHQCGHLRCPARLAEDRDIAGVAAERLRVITHPAQRRHHVQNAGIAGIGETGVAVADVQVTEHVEAMIDRNHHHVAAAREMRAVEARCGPGTVRPSPAMQPHHDRAAFTPKAWRENIEEQAVLTDRLDSSIPREQRAQGTADLWSGSAKTQGITNSRPGRHRYRWQEAVCSAGCFTIANTFEGEHTAIAKHPVTCPASSPPPVRRRLCRAGQAKCKRRRRKLQHGTASEGIFDCHLGSPPLHHWSGVDFRFGLVATYEEQLAFIVHCVAAFLSVRPPRASAF